MGGTMTSVPRTPAESTVILLQEAALKGSPVLIPGAREPRPGGAAARLPQSSDLPVMRHAHSTAVSPRERLEREREGGGAPSERASGQRARILARLWRTLLHPTEIAVIWSRALLQPR
jgi:hypothetical protein